MTPASAQHPAGKGTINSPNRYGMEPFYAEVATVAAREIMATGACARTQTLSDARAATQGYLASLGPAVAAVLRGSDDDRGLPYSNVWISMLTPRRVGSIRRPSAIRAVSLLIPQALLTLCSSILADRPVPVAQATPQTPVARTVTGETVQGAPVARPGPQEYVSTSVPVARPAPVDATPRFPALRPRDLPSIPVTSDRQGYTQENTDWRSAGKARSAPVTGEVLTQLRREALGQVVRAMSIACDRIMTVADAQRAAQAYLASMNPVITSVLARRYEGIVIPPWLLTVLRGGEENAQEGVRFVTSGLVQAVLDHCGTVLSAQPLAVFSPILAPPQTGRTKGTVSLSTLQQTALRAATADALGLSGMSVCSDIAFLPGSRDRAIQSVVSRFRSSWTPQMVAVMNGLAVQPTLDGPRWYREMMAQVSGPTDARQILAYVIQQMPNSIVNLCADIRRQAERE